MPIRLPGVLAVGGPFQGVQVSIAHVAGELLLRSDAGVLALFAALNRVSSRNQAIYVLGSVMSGGQTKKVLALIRPGSTVIDDLIRGFDEGGSSFYALSALNSLLAQSFKQEDEAKRYWQANKKSFFEARSMSK